jgi:hypothetical protein
MPVDWDAHVLAPCEGVFGELATYSPASGAPFAIVGVFDREYHEVALLDPTAPADSALPVLGVRLAIFATYPAKNDKVFIPSVGLSFIVKDVRPDGHGWAKLMLALAKAQP